jgi:hypothetical protein
VLLFPARRIHLGSGSRLEHHVIARHAFEAAGAFQIALDDLGHVEAAVGRHCARERDHGDRDGVGDAFRDGESQLRERRRRSGSDQQQADREFFHA